MSATHPKITLILHQNPVRYSPEYADNDMTFNPNAPFSPDSAARGSGAFRFPVDLNTSPDLRRTEFGGRVLAQTLNS
jgi:hypothetical protein